MYLIDDVILATRTFRTRKLRTFLTILGISVGIGTIMFLVSLGYGMQRVLLEKITRLDALLSLDVVVSGDMPIVIDDDMIRQFKDIPNVIEVSPIKTVSSTCEYGDLSTGVSFSAVDSAYFRLEGIDLFAGEIFHADKDMGVVLSQGALASLGMKDVKDAVGKKIKITLNAPKNSLDAEQLFADKDKEDTGRGFDSLVLPDVFAIVGVVEDESNSFGYIPIAWTGDLHISTYDSVKVRVREQEDIEEVRKMIINKGFSVLALSDTIDQANKIFAVVQFVLALFGLVALVVSAIGMFNTMTIALLERTGEIGTMKSIGASNRDIRIMFLMESVLIGFSGGLGGLALGAFGISLINFIFNELAGRLGGQSVDLFVTPLWFVVFIILFSTVIGLITGIYPAERASRLNPLMAIRYR